MNSFGIISDDYIVFLEKRADVIFKELKKRIDLKHKEDKKEDRVKELILNGESETFEMKSTLRYDVKEGMVNKKLEYVVAKTVSAFLNTEGGTLIIGVDDDDNILGLERDLKTLTKQNNDGFELHLRQVIKKYLGDYFEKYIKVTFPKVDDKEICKIQISRSGKPVFITFEGTESFFVRNGNASIPKNRQEQSEYEKIHWNK